MTDDVVIRVEGLSKSYQISHQAQKGQSYQRLSEDLVSWASWPWRKMQSVLHHQGSDKPSVEEFWALKDVSFEVKRGEVIGIIGRNGAGKSTLLKILSRITEPTCGRVEIDGRVASLLEVGTGFHPELTGRENIYLNGAILGMSRAEIKSKFDEIVDFAEVERFLDTPVKRYSSGMYVRLAFAVAAHLEPEILVVDEVLAVGDAAFQKKCLGKMGDVAKEGRTVVFVSHNMAAIQRLCEQCIVLESGMVRAKMPTTQAVSMYLEQLSGTEQYSQSVDTGIIDVKYLGLSRVDSPKTAFRFGTNESIELRFDYEWKVPIEDVRVGVWFLTAEGHTFMAAFDTDTYPALLAHRGAGTYNSRMTIPAALLNAGEYTLRVLVYVHYGKVYFDDSSLFLQIIDSNDESVHTGWGYRVGQIVPRFNWGVTYHA